MSHEPQPDSETDGLLLSRVAAGDSAAFATLFRRCQRGVYRFALHMTGIPAVAEDITQDVFLTVMRDAARYDPDRSSAAAWLCGIARNHARRRIERDLRVQPLEHDDSGEGHVSGDASPLEEIAQAERIDALRRAVLSLPIRYREAVVLCDLQELSYQDAAAALDCAVGTIRSRLHRGRTLLAAKMRGDATSVARLHPDDGRGTDTDPTRTPDVGKVKRMSRCVA